MGIDCPIVHNSAGVSMDAYFRETVDAMGEGFVLGSDHYYCLHQDAGQNNPTPQFATKVLASNEMLRLYGFPPTDLRAAVRHVLGLAAHHGGDAKAFYLTNLALGMKGHNYYIFTGGPNPPGMGATGDVYDFGRAGAPGRRGPLALLVAQESFGRFVGQHPWLARAGREPTAASRSTGRCRAARGTGRAARGWPSSRLTRGGSSSKGPLTTALCASMSPAFVALDSDDWLADTTTPVVASAASAMSRARQERLVRFLSGGGSALLAPVLPVVDENLTAVHGARRSSSARRRCRAPDPGAHTALRSATSPTSTATRASSSRRRRPRAPRYSGPRSIRATPVAWELVGAGRRPGGDARPASGFTRCASTSAMLAPASFERSGLRRKVSCTNPNVWTSLRTAETAP